MTAEIVAPVVALGLPVLTLALAFGLVRAVSQLERSRDELIELGVPRR